eukprot:GHVS01071949.1.p1 GENE.GHVS01071949.1~~GHVS01071949.1.p1  ORF type:complete len:256 (-),score=26.08 GHVS01071949.1:174-881(-)
MFLLSRRSAFFALFVILAFATTTLLAVGDDKAVSADSLIAGGGQPVSPVTVLAEGTTPAVWSWGDCIGWLWKRVSGRLWPTAFKRITAEQREEGAKLCFGYHGGDWYKVIMINSLDQIFEAEDGSGNIVFGLEKVSDTENRCVVWDVSKPTRRFLVDPKTQKGTIDEQRIYEQCIYEQCIYEQSNCYLVLLTIKAPGLRTSGEISKEWEMTLYFEINRVNPSPELKNVKFAWLQM